MERFPILRDPFWRLPLLLIAATEARSIVTIDDDTIDLQFGIAHVTIPIANVASVRQREWSWILGVGLRIASDKTLGLIGSSRGVVQIALRERTVDGLLLLRKPKNVAVSLEDPWGFIEAVERRR